MKQEQNSLTSQQLSELRELFVDRYVDNMSTKDLVEYVYNDMTQYVESQPDNEFINDCKDYWEDDFDIIMEEVNEICDSNNSVT
jgi:hypothetical protein